MRLEVDRRKKAHTKVRVKEYTNGKLWSVIKLYGYREMGKYELRTSKRKRNVGRKAKNCKKQTCRT